jgi:TetR/AcrR family transcriptional regulator, tetracycline repressor protein
VRERNRPGLTREMIIQTALRVLEDTGLDGLTVRKLAAGLGVQSPALYWHFRSKQELLDGMADAIIIAAGMSPPHEGESWQHWLTRRARAYHQSLRAHRDGARVVASARALSPATVKTFDQELDVLVNQGFAPVFALRTIAALTRYVNGFALYEQTGPHQDTPPPPGQIPALTKLLDGVTSATLLRALRDGGSLLSEQAFEHGLRALIDGTAVALAHQPQPLPVSLTRPPSPPIGTLRGAGKASAQ